MQKNMVLRCFYHMIADNLTVKIYPTVTVTCIKFTGLVNTSVRYNKITKKKLETAVFLGSSTHPFIL